MAVKNIFELEASLNFMPDPFPFYNQGPYTELINKTPDFPWSRSNTELIDKIGASPWFPLGITNNILEPFRFIEDDGPYPDLPLYLL